VGAATRLNYLINACAFFLTDAVHIFLSSLECRRPRGQTIDLVAPTEHVGRGEVVTWLETLEVMSPPRWAKSGTLESDQCNGLSTGTDSSFDSGDWYPGSDFRYICVDLSEV
jgi:hypothetical protein